VLTLIVAGVLVALVWLYRDRAWLQDFPRDCWVIAVRVDGSPSNLELYEPAREMVLYAVEATNARHPGQLEWDHGRPGWHQTWPEYGTCRAAVSRGKEGSLPEPEELLQQCLRSLEKVRGGGHVHGTWRIAVHDDQGRLVGPVRVRFPELLE